VKEFKLDDKLKTLGNANLGPLEGSKKVDSNYYTHNKYSSNNNSKAVENKPKTNNHYFMDQNEKNKENTNTNKMNYQMNNNINKVQEKEIEHHDHQDEPVEDDYEDEYGGENNFEDVDEDDN
jgi:hypothetical protein